MAARDDDSAKSIPQVASELWELSTAYAKQETLDPLKGLKRYLAFGLGGILLLSIGSLLLLLAALRALQTETDTVFAGHWSWAPYGITTVAAVLVLAVALWRIVKRKGPGL